MGAYWIWWIAAAVLIGAELLTGTIYLLAIGTGAVVGGVVAWLGVGLPLQFLVGGGLAVLLTVAVHQWRRRHALPVAQDPLDVGQAVHVQSWNADGTARVSYRGTLWDAELATPATPRVDTMYIVAMRGSVLVLSDRRTPP